jgi:hypothetical protein
MDDADRTERALSSIQFSLIGKNKIKEKKKRGESYEDTIERLIGS